MRVIWRKKDRKNIPTELTTNKAKRVKEKKMMKLFCGLLFYVMRDVKDFEVLSFISTWKNLSFFKEFSSNSSDDFKLQNNCNNR